MGRTGKRANRLERESDLYEISRISRSHLFRTVGPANPLEKSTMSQTRILILITALATTLAIDISCFAKLGILEKAVQ